MNTILDVKPILKDMEVTGKLLANQGYTFDEVGQSFDEAGVQFGGIYGVDGRKPTIYSIKDL